jgi:hypothetical protein
MVTETGRRINWEQEHRTEQTLCSMCVTHARTNSAQYFSDIVIWPHLTSASVWRATQKYIGGKLESKRTNNVLRLVAFQSAIWNEKQWNLGGSSSCLQGVLPWKNRVVSPKLMPIYTSFTLKTEAQGLSENLGLSLFYPENRDSRFLWKICPYPPTFLPWRWKHKVVRRYWYLFYR